MGSCVEMNWMAPFVPAKPPRGQVTYPGYEHVQWEAVYVGRRWARTALYPSPGNPLCCRPPKVDYSKGDSYARRRIQAGERTFQWYT